MTKDEVNGKLIHRVMELEKSLKEINKNIDNIIKSIVSIGGPLNDNVKRYTSSQLKDFQYILDNAEEVQDDILNIFNDAYE